MKKRGALVQLISSYTNVVFAMVSGLLFVPMYLNHFSLSVYGAWLASGNILNLLSILEGGLGVVISQRLALTFASENKEDFSKIASAGIAILLSLGLLILACSFFLSYFIDDILDLASGAAEIQMAFILAGVGVAFSMLNASLTFISRSWHKNEIPEAITLFSVILGLVSIVVSIKYFSLGIISLGIGALVRSSSSCLGMIWFVTVSWRARQLPAPCLDRRAILSVSASSAPIFTANIFGVVLNNSRELMLGTILNPATVAIVSISSRFFGIVTMILNPISFSLFNALSSFSNNKEKFVTWVLKLERTYNMLSSILFGVALVINGYFISAWLGKDKYGGIVLSAFLGTSCWLTTRSNLEIIVLNAKGIFNKTAFFGILDFVIRLCIIGCLILMKVRFEIFYLPLIECFSIGVCLYLLQIAVYRSIFNKQIANPFNDFLRVLFATLVVSISIALIMPNILPVVGRWIDVIIVGGIASSLFTGSHMLSRHNRDLLRSLYSRKVLPVT